MNKSINIDMSDVVYGHQLCPTKRAKWLCIDNIYEKFYRPNFYDIGGTNIEDLADYWFIFKTEQVDKIFLLHLFVTNKREGSYTVSVSQFSQLLFDPKKGGYLPTSLQAYQFENAKANSLVYITTYSFCDIDVDMLKNKSFYIPVSFKVTPGYEVSDEIADKVKTNHDFGALLKDPIGSDFVIESADGKQFQVHKVLLAAHSEVFKAMLKDDTAESQNNYVKLIDVSEDDLKFILEFIYTGTIKDLESCNCVNLLMAADRYNMSGLFELSEHVLTNHLSEENALETLVVADLCNSSMLKIATLKFIKQNVDTLKMSTFKEINNASLVRELCEFLVLS